MKRNIIITTCVLISALMLGLSGFTLAQPELDKTNDDKLIGVYITTDYLDLFDFEAYLNDNLDTFTDVQLVVDGETSKYQGRLYATTIDNQYVFEGADGIPLFYHTVVDENGTYSSVTGGEKISDGHTSISNTDDGVSIALEGTIYAAPTKDIVTYYINPVYQSVDGRIYVVSGSGISFDNDGAEGGAFSQILDSTTTVTENGASKTYSISVKTSISLKHPPVSHSILQFDSEGIIISIETYLPGKLPQEISPDSNCSYIILESKTKENTTRTLYQKDDTTLESFYLGDDSILVIQFTTLEWVE